MRLHHGHAHHPRPHGRHCAVAGAPVHLHEAPSVVRQQCAIAGRGCRLMLGRPPPPASQLGVLQQFALPIHAIKWQCKGAGRGVRLLEKKIVQLGVGFSHQSGVQRINERLQLIRRLLEKEARQLVR